MPGTAPLEARRGLPGEGREALGTKALEGQPDVILKMPGDSYAPFWLSLFAMLVFAGLVLRAELFTAAMLLACAITIVVWLWPERALLQREPQTVSETGD